MSELVRNSADKEQLKRASRSVKRRREQELNDLRHVLSERAGRRFFWRLLSECGTFHLSFTGRAEDTFFNEGRRSVGNRLLVELNEAQPDCYFTMIKEEKEDNERANPTDSSGPDSNGPSESPDEF